MEGTHGTMKSAILYLVFLLPASLLCAEEEPGRGDERYFDYSESASRYDSYGRPRSGCRDAPLRRYPFGREPYYYYSENSPWYDSYGRLRFGPRGVPAAEYWTNR